MAEAQRANSRARCRVHDIAMGDDGRCMLCQRTRPLPTREPRSPWPILGGFALVFFLALGAYAVMRRGESVAATPDPVNSPPPADESDNAPPVANVQPTRKRPSIEERREEVRREIEENKELLDDEMHRVPITMYTTPTCVHCKRAREWFSANGYRYTERDVDADGRWARKLAELNPQNSVPTIDIGGVVVTGFSERGVQSTLRSVAAKNME